MAVHDRRRYGPTARWYDLLSLERPIYRPGRLAGVRALRLTAGDRVLDVGCGTGLNFSLLRAAVGPDGAVVGLDASPAMLRQAEVRIRRRRWSNVDVVFADAAEPPADLATQRFQAVLFTYALSVFDDWRSAWHAGLARLEAGGRASVVDLALPVGRWRWLTPAARLACFAGGSDPRRHPWTLMADSLVDVTDRALRGGHIRVVSGTRPRPGM